ncbi:MAG: PAS domain S-box protein, partial [Candidatus Omnitrophica bacterium]|nr:PAS domain S-box protein [Candidatus Omnitrophota bacterium]
MAVMTKVPSPSRTNSDTRGGNRLPPEPFDGSEESLRLLVDHVPGVIYLCRNDPHFNMLFLSESIQNLVGYPASDFLSGEVSFVDLYHPEDAPKIFSQVSESLKAEKRYHLIYRLRDRSGNWKWVEEFGLGIEREGCTDFLEGYLRDITDRIEAEQALRHSEEFNRRIVETVPAGIVRIDMEGSVRLANLHAEKILGLSYDELTQKYIYDFQTDTVWEDGTPCPYTEYPAFKCLKTLEEQPPVTMGVRKKDGKISWGIYSATPIFDETTKEPKGAVVTVLDITWRKEAEEKIQSSKTRWRTLVENAPNFVAIIDPQGNYQYINRVAKGFDREEVLSADVFKWVSPNQHKVIRDSIKETIRTGGPVKYEVEVVVPGSGSTWWSSCMGLIDPSVDPPQIMVISTDITNEKRAKEDLARAHSELEERVRVRTHQLTQANQRLQEEIVEREKVQKKLQDAMEIAESANRAKGDFIASMSHELRTPLTSVLGFVGLLEGERHGELTESQNDFVSTIRRNAEHLLSLINDILDVAKTEAGEGELVKSVVDLDMLVRQC